MRIQLLGSVEVHDDDGAMVAIGPPKRRIVLALLAMDPGRVVSTQRLIDALWDEHPPKSALATLQGHVYELRQLLGAGAIESRPPGYRLVPDGFTIDAIELATTADHDATSDTSYHRPAQGRPLDDLGDGLAVGAARRQLDDLRMRAVERWCWHELSVGRAGDLIEVVHGELVDHVWRESLWELLMRLLYAVGRQADALAAYTRARLVLVEDLGLEPGPALRQLHQQILDHDPALQITSVPASTTSPRGAGRRAASSTRTAFADRSTPLIGRLGELAHLRGRLDRSPGSVSMVLGEPGVGKTRLVAELAEEARARGDIVLWGHCPDGGWAAPYAPLVEALDRYLASLDRDVARALLMPVAPRLAAVIPIVTSLFPEAVAANDGDPAELRFEILDALGRLIQTVAGIRPVALVIDDLHWVDHASAAALSFLMPRTAEIDLHIVGTYRDTEVGDSHPLTDALASAHRLVTIDRVRLRGLADGPALTLIDQLDVDGVDDQTAAALVAASGGNPFFLTELVRFRRTSADVALPDSVNDTIRQRLARLSEATNTLLRVGALFDGSFPLEATRVVAELDETSALDSLDEAIEGHLIEPTEQFDEYRFVHALTRVAARSTINPSRLLRLTRRLAVTLDEHRGANISAPELARIAGLYHASRPLPGAERGVEPALAAAAQADAVAAHTERAELLRVAVELMSPDDSRRSRTLANLTIALVRSFRSDEALDLGLGAAEQILRTEGTESACELLADLVFAVRSTGSWPTAGGLDRWTERGIELGSGGEPSPGYAYLYTTLHSDRIIPINEWNFVERAQLFADEEYVRLGRLTIERRFERADRLSTIAGIATRREASDLAVDCAATLSEYTGDLHNIADRDRAALEVSRRLGRTGSVVENLVVLAPTAACLGHLGVARAHLDEAAHIQQVIPPQDGRLARTNMADLIVTGLADGPWGDYIERSKTRGDLMVRWSDHNRPTGFGDRMWPKAMACAALVHGRRGRTDSALALVRELIDYVRGAAVCEFGYTFIAYACVDALWFCGGPSVDVDVTATELQAAIEDRWAPCDFRYFWTDYRLALARLCALTGDVAQAAKWFGTARQIYTEQDASSLLAIVDFDEAWMHVRHPGAVDTDTVIALLERATGQFAELGMPGWLTRSATLTDALLSVPPGQR